MSERDRANVYVEMARPTRTAARRRFEVLAYARRGAPEAPKHPKVAHHIHLYIRFSSKFTGDFLGTEYTFIMENIYYALKFMFSRARLLYIYTFFSFLAQSLCICVSVVGEVFSPKKNTHRFSSLSIPTSSPNALPKKSIFLLLILFCFFFLFQY